MSSIYIKFNLIPESVFGDNSLVINPESNIIDFDTQLINDNSNVKPNNFPDPKDELYYQVTFRKFEGYFVGNLIKIFNHTFYVDEYKMNIFHFSLDIASKSLGEMPEFIMLTNGINLKLYKYYNIYELSDSYSGRIVQTDGILIYLREKPIYDIKLSELSVDKLHIFFNHARFRIDMDNNVFLSMYNFITSALRNHTENYIYVPPIQLRN